ncbi:MAG: mechanosensitive ion channel domain-containing protein [Gammaproteobacteria bacterium]
MDPLILAIKSIVYGGFVLGGAYFVHKMLTARIVEPVGRSYRLQLLTLGVSLATILILLVVLPFNDTLRGQLLSLTGILLSAVIALSSTTFVGNVMAGAMLRSIKCCSPGDYVHVGDYFGRISEMDLLHVEVQTEDRDLVTLPNLYTVTNPMKVLRSSGTIISAELSLGYDVSHKTVETNLLLAAEAAGLEQPFVHIKQLGDYSIVYRINGLLKDLNVLLSTRSRLRAKVIEQLHGAGIEIVSPTFMNQRQYKPDVTFIPIKEFGDEQDLEERASDSVVFDKGAKAESLKEVKDRHMKIVEEIRELETLKKATEDETLKRGFQERIENLGAQALRWQQVVTKREEILHNED